MLLDYIRLQLMIFCIVFFHRTLRSELQKLRGADGFESFREKETKELAEIVEQRIHSLQNPKDCDNAKKLLCSLNKGWICWIVKIEFKNSWSQF